MKFWKKTYLVRRSKLSKKEKVYLHKNLYHMYHLERMHPVLSKTLPKQTAQENCNLQIYMIQKIYNVMNEQHYLKMYILHILVCNYQDTCYIHLKINILHISRFILKFIYCRSWDIVLEMCFIL